MILRTDGAVNSVMLILAPVLSQRAICRETENNQSDDTKQRFHGTVLSKKGR